MSCTVCRRCSPTQPPASFGTAVLPGLSHILSCQRAQPNLTLHRIVDALVDAARAAGCYKVILDCAEDNVAFYSKSGFKRKEVQMVRAQPLPL